MRGQVMKMLARLVHANTASAPPISAAKVAAQRRRAATWGLGVGVGLGTIGAGVMAWRDNQKQHNVIMNREGDNSFLLAEKPPFSPSRSVKYATDPAGLGLTLYQYQTCPFCCKVRAMLDFFGIPYNVVEVNPVLRTQLKWSEKYKKVPILIVETPEGELLQLNDSSMIVSVIYSYMMANSSTKSGNKNSQLVRNGTVHDIAKFYPSIRYTDDAGKEQSDIMNRHFLMFGDTENRSKEDILAERRWRSWVDSVYVHTLSPNIYRTMSESLDSFRYFDKVGEWEKNFKTWERTLVIYVGALAMWMIGKRLQKKYNLKEDVRESLYDASNHWLAAVKATDGDFMGGTSPNLADLAAYGVLSSIEGCEAFQDLDQNSAIVRDWYYKVKQSLQHPLEQESSV